MGIKVGYQIKYFDAKRILYPRRQQATVCVVREVWGERERESCVCVRERESEKERELCVCVCVCLPRHAFCERLVTDTKHLRITHRGMHVNVSKLKQG